MIRHESRRSNGNMSRSLPSKHEAVAHLPAVESDLGSAVQQGVGQGFHNLYRSRQGEFRESAIGDSKRESDSMGSILRESVRAELKSPSHELALWSRIPPIPRQRSLPGNGRISENGIANSEQNIALSDEGGTLSSSSASDCFNVILGVDGQKMAAEPSDEELRFEPSQLPAASVLSDILSVPSSSDHSSIDLNNQSHSMLLGESPTIGHGKRPHFSREASERHSSNLEGSFEIPGPSSSSGCSDASRLVEPVAPMDSAVFNLMESVGAAWKSEGEISPTEEQPFLKDPEGLVCSASGRNYAGAFSTMDLNANGIGEGSSDYAVQGLSFPDSLAALREDGSSFIRRADAPYSNGTISPSQWGQSSAGSGSDASVDLSKTNELLQMLLDEVRKGKDPFLPLVSREASFP